MSPEDREQKISETIVIVVGWFGAMICLGFAIGPMWEWGPIVMLGSGTIALWLTVRLWQRGADEALQRKLLHSFWIITAWGVFCLVWFYAAGFQLLPNWAVGLAPLVAFAYTLAMFSSVWRRG